MNSEILFPFATYPDACSTILVSQVIKVAEHLNSKLHAIALNVDIPNVSSALGGILLNLPNLIIEVEARSRASGDELLRVIEKEAATAGIDLSQSLSLAQPANFGEVAALEARYYDLSVVGWTPESTGRMVAEGLIFGSGRPVLLLPEASAVHGFDEMMIAWDGSRVAARALADAQPFVSRSKILKIISVLDEKPLPEGDNAERLAKSLIRRGLRAEAISVNADGSSIGETLQSRALEMGVGLLVMGGYGHNRLRDFVLGGATKDILSDLRLPVLMAH